MNAVSVSAPGKVLFAGGYLVLDRKYTGLVFGLNARIHVTVHPTLKCIEPGNGAGKIFVRSPQFKGAEWAYGFTPANGNVDVQQLLG